MGLKRGWELHAAQRLVPWADILSHAYFSSGGRVPRASPRSGLGDEGARAAVLITAGLRCGDGYIGAIK